MHITKKPQNKKLISKYQFGKDITNPNKLDIYDKSAKVGNKTYPARTMIINGKERTVFLADDNKMYAVGDNGAPYEIWSQYDLPEVTVSAKPDNVTKDDKNQKLIYNKGSMKNAQGNYYNTRADDYDDHLRSRDDIDKIMIGTLGLGISPIALAEGVGALTTAGNAASDYVMGTKWGQLINNGLKTVSAATASTPWWPYVDTAVNSAFTADGINNVAHGNINLGTALELTPLVRVGKGITDATVKGAEKVASYLSKDKTTVNTLSTLNNTNKNVARNSTLISDNTAKNNYKLLGAEPVTIDEVSKLNHPDYIMPLFKLRQPKEVKEFYPEMLRRLKDNFNVKSEDLTETFNKQAETPIYIGKYDNPNYSGTHMVNTGESYVSLNDPNPISTALHEAARHGTDDAIYKYAPEAWKGYTDFISTLEPYMKDLITEDSKYPAELRATLGEVYLRLHKLVTKANSSNILEKLANLVNKSKNQYERFGKTTEHKINDIISDNDILSILENTNAYGQDYANALRAMKEKPSVYAQALKEDQKWINYFQQELKRPDISEEIAKNFSKYLKINQMNYVDDAKKLQDYKQEYSKAMTKLRELLTKYPMFTGAVVTGAGYQTTKHKNGGKMKIHIKKKNKGKFTTYCGGTVTQACINRAKASGNTTLVKRATFAENVRKWKHKNGGILQKLQNGGYVSNSSQPQVLQRYIGLLNNGIKPQAAFDTSHLSIIEDGRPGKYYSFGKRANTLNGWIKNATDSLTIGRYKNLQNVQNFGQFKQGLKQKNYNTRPAFYNVEINRGRNRDKQIINQWNRQNGVPLISMLSNNYGQTETV